MFRTVEFRHTFPNEWQFHANGSPLAPGARELAEIIAREVGKHANVITPVEQHSYYGWAFDVRFAGCRFVNVVNPADEVCYLTVQLFWYWLRALLCQRPRQTFDEYNKMLGDALAAIAEVSGGLGRVPSIMLCTFGGYQQ